ncbi:hypothetical protein Tsubulata_024786 [Turnera subulata]|uniref:Uncharacterized protein n=1 Tax=Turnera subulata TaxID=218843 RepID=A0A9Q0GK95_9ROSI|nr:hypothetical protein Tsubulata_024786 [Turnera subulata]
MDVQSAMPISIFQGTQALAPSNNNSTELKILILLTYNVILDYVLHSMSTQLINKTKFVVHILKLVHIVLCVMNLSCLGQKNILVIFVLLGLICFQHG